MERIKAFFTPAKAGTDEYEPLANGDADTLDESTRDDGVPFSWLEYSIFAMIGMAMLWAWNMFLAAAPYFNTRFQLDAWISANSQSAIITTFTVTNLVSLLVLANRQSSANYPFRIATALVINAGVFSLLTLSTLSFLGASPREYLAFLLAMVATTALAAGLMQNGAFAFAASFGRPEYTQAIMAGQGVAGILPPLAQIITFLAFSDSSPAAPDQADSEATSPSPTPTNDNKDTKGSNAASIYFLTAVIICALTLLAFIPLVRRHIRRRRLSATTTTPEVQATGHPLTATPRQHVPLPTLLRKLRWLAAAVFVCFALTMLYPVFTAKILSVHDPAAAGRLFAPGAFIPLGFFFWNLGDLAGRVATMLPFSLRHRPRVLFGIALLRGGLLPLYLLCNIRGEGAVVGSDLFYLGVVQVLFGLTNGWLGSSVMMAAGEWVAEGEREAAGGFMGLCLVAGLAAGGVLSFSAAGV